MKGGEGGRRDEKAVVSLGCGGRRRGRREEKGGEGIGRDPMESIGTNRKDRKGIGRHRTASEGHWKGRAARASSGDWRRLGGDWAELGGEHACSWKAGVIIVGLAEGEASSASDSMSSRSVESRSYARASKRMRSACMRAEGDPCSRCRRIAAATRSRRCVGDERKEIGGSSTSTALASTRVVTARASVSSAGPRSRKRYCSAVTPSSRAQECT